MTTSTTNQIRALGSRWIDAELAADTDALDTLVADDFHLVGPFGFVLDKQQWLDRYRSGDFATTALTWHDVDMREYRDTVVTIGTQSQQAAYKGIAVQRRLPHHPRVRARPRAVDDRRHATQPSHPSQSHASPGYETMNRTLVPPTFPMGRSLGRQLPQIAGSVGQRGPPPSSSRSPRIQERAPGRERLLVGVPVWSCGWAASASDRGKDGSPSVHDGELGAYRFLRDLVSEDLLEKGVHDRVESFLGEPVAVLL